MTGLEIVGLASNIISFIDFGFKLVTVTREVRGSQHGTTAEVNELAHLMDKVELSNAQVRDMRLSGDTLSKEERMLSELVKDCGMLAEEMKKIMARLERSSTSWKTYEDWRVAFQTLSKRRELEHLRLRFEALDEMIRTCFTEILQSDRHSATTAQLDKIINQQKSLGINYDGRLDNLKDELIDLMTEQLVNSEQRAENRLAQIENLELLQQEHGTCINQTKIIRSLYVPVLSKRWREIVTADENSNDWLFGPELNSYTEWLRYGDGVYLITGKPGSGKSTLMKYAAEHVESMRNLRLWAGSSRLFTASFFLWNEGFDLQKSQRGLFQSLLYQVLRAEPKLAKHVSCDRLEHETWELDHLEATFRKISEAELDARFCFFIDGLDEYDGQESELADIIQTLTNSQNIKCVLSSRYRFIYENEIENLRHKIEIADYTREDMDNHVRDQLLQERNFKRLHNLDRPGCEKIVTDITGYAQGVWLWVSLVTKDIVRAVKTGEQVEKLQEITKNFPRSLKKYFKTMIDRIDPVYQNEMAKIFLIAISARVPQPLFAYSLLEKEQTDRNHAISAPFRPPRDFAREECKSRLHNRCGDLMVVKDELRSSYFRPLPLNMSFPVEFMHRTVAEYLRENHESDLRARLDAAFDPVLSLCRMQLYLLKSLDARDRSDALSNLMTLSYELLHYAHEVDSRLRDEVDSPAHVLLDELERVNSRHARLYSIRYHWTHLLDLQGSARWNRIMSMENSNFLALAVQVGLRKYVGAKLRQNASQIAKEGRPLLDYALRPHMGYLSHDLQVPLKDPLRVDVALVHLLLHFDPHQSLTINKREVMLYPDATPWTLFLALCYKRSLAPEFDRSAGLYPVTRHKVTDTHVQSWFETCEALLHAGADPNNGVRITQELDVAGIIKEVFDEDKSAYLFRLMEEKRKEAEYAWQDAWKCTVM